MPEKSRHKSRTQLSVEKVSACVWDSDYDIKPLKGYCNIINEELLFGLKNITQYSTFQ